MNKKELSNKLERALCAALTSEDLRVSKLKTIERLSKDFIDELEREIKGLMSKKIRENR